MTQILAYLLAACFVLFGVQTYRLQGAKAEIAVMKTERKAQEAAAAVRAGQDLKNKERTDEEYAAAQRRATSARVRVEFAPSPAIPAPAAGSGDQDLECYSRRALDSELAGWVERGNQRFTRIAQEGEAVAAAFRSCKAYVLGLAGVPGQTTPEAGPRLDGRYLRVVAAGVQVPL